jgi:hypothetical protein
MRVTVDTREPSPHPWSKFLPDGWELVRERLETGDLALAAIPEAAVVERKTPSDLVACMTSARDRFERELMRSRYVGRLVVVIEGGLQDVLAARRQMSEASVIWHPGRLDAAFLSFCFLWFTARSRQLCLQILGCPSPRRRTHGQGYKPLGGNLPTSQQGKSPWRAL